MLAFEFELGNFSKVLEVQHILISVLVEGSSSKGNLSKAEEVENILIPVLVEDSSSIQETF